MNLMNQCLSFYAVGVLRGCYAVLQGLDFSTLDKVNIRMNIRETLLLQTFPLSVSVIYGKVKHKTSQASSFLRQPGLNPTGRCLLLSNIIFAASFPLPLPEVSTVVHH